MQSLFRNLTIVLAVTASGQAWSVADIRGVAGAIASSGQCNDAKQMNLHVDALNLKATAACGGQSAETELRADAATESIGLRGQAVGSQFGSSQAAGSVNLSDRLLFTVPTGTRDGTVFHVPVTFTLDGLISGDALYDTLYNRFIDFDFSIDAFGVGFQKFGQIASTGAYSQSFSGIADLSYAGGTLPLVANLSLQLDLVSLLYGTADFFHTATVSLDLPTGMSVTNSSGVPLFIKAVTPPTTVPEPSGLLLLVAGVRALGMTMTSGRRVGRHAAMGGFAS